ncbi:MAG: hypothetical protein ACYDH9_15205 [Limisphaerales bacterium]
MEENVVCQERTKIGSLAIPLVAADAGAMLRAEQERDFLLGQA